MSEESNASAEQDQAAAPDDTKRNDIDALERKNREILAEKQKISKEKQELKEANQQFQERLDKNEQEKLESQGKYADINKSLKERLIASEQFNKDMTARFTKKSLSEVVQRAAMELGAEYPDAVTKLLDKSDLEMVSVDENFQVDEVGVKLALENVKLKYPTLFKKQAPSVKDKSPMPSNFVGIQSDKKVREMSLAELGATYKKVIK